MKKLSLVLFSLMAGCTVTHIVPYAYIVGDIVAVSEEQLPQYWVHSDIPPKAMNGPGKMGCVRLSFVIDSRAGIWNPQVESIYGDQAVADWAIGVLNGISFGPSGTNNAKRAVSTTLTLTYSHAPQDVKDWDACQAAIGKTPAGAHN